MSVTFTLEGCLLPLGRARGFLIPYFRSPTSDAAFVQDLDEDFRIDRFVFVDLTSFHRSRAALAPTQVKRGDEGLMAFAFEEGQPEVLQVTVMRHRLKARPFDLESPLVECEVAHFLEDEDRLVRALAQVARVFGEASVVERWKAIELSTFATDRRIGTPARLWAMPWLLAKPSVEPPHSDPAFNKLIEGILDPDWPSRWLSEWDAAMQRGRMSARVPELLDAAAYWLERTNFSSKWAPTVIQAVTPHRIRATSDFSRALTTWLSRKPPSYSGWPKEWMFAWRGAKERSDLAALGTDFLSKTIAAAPHIRRAAWEDVWRTLWDAGEGNNARLVELAEAARPYLEKRKGWLAEIVARVAEHRGPNFAVPLIQEQLAALTEEDPNHQRLLTRLAYGGHHTNQAGEAARRWLSEPMHWPDHWGWHWRAWARILGKEDALAALDRRLQGADHREAWDIAYSIRDALKFFGKDPRLLAMMEAWTTKDISPLLREELATLVSDLPD